MVHMQGSAHFKLYATLNILSGKHIKQKSQEKHRFLEHCYDMASPTQNIIALNVV